MDSHNIMNPQSIDLKLAKAHSANPSSYDNFYGPDYTQNMGYYDNSLHPFGISPSHGQMRMMHPPIMQITSNNVAPPGGFGNHMQYPQYERESYSPDFDHHNFMAVPEQRRFSTNEAIYPQTNWGQYQGHYNQYYAYQNQVAARPSAPEALRNYRSDSSHSSNLEKKSSSLGDDEHKSSKDVDEGPAADLSSSKLVENASQLAKDQSGCRLLQKKIEEGNREVITAIYNNILPNFVDLMNNPFGNYLCQRITDVCSKEQLKEIIKKIEADVVDICCNSHGTRAIQRIIE
jgi:hypothetical protein